MPLIVPATDHLNVNICLKPIGIDVAIAWYPLFALQALMTSNYCQ